MVLGSRNDVARRQLDIVPDPSDRLADELYERGAGRSNVMAFLLGGVVAAGGLVAFLYHDADRYPARDGSTTGSLGRIEQPAIRILPSNPDRSPPPAMD